MCTDPARMLQPCTSGSGSHSARRRAIPLLAGCLLFACIAAPASAQQEERYYQIEVVVFEQPEGSSVELPPLRRPPPKEEPGLLPEPEPEPPSRGQGWPPAEEPVEAEQLLPPGFSAPLLPLQLEAVAARLNRGGYRLLWHQAWVQPPTESEGAALEWLAALGQGPVTPELSGKITLSAGRFLHLGMDLEMQSALGLEAELSQRRRIRTDIAQYFDHPRIGVVAIVTRLEFDPDQPSPSPASTP